MRPDCENYVDKTVRAERSADAPTLVRTPSEDVAPKLSRIRPGYWRNRWRSNPRAPYPKGVTKLGDGTHLGPAHHPSAEIAEQSARQTAGTYFEICWLGAVFFPGEEA